MPYDEQHKLLTFHGTSWSPNPETWQIGFRIAQTNGLISQAMVDSARDAFSTLWSSTTINVPNVHKFAYAKLALIGTDGKYPEGIDPYISDKVPDQAGPGGAGLGWPPQCAIAVSLTTSRDRGLAHRGRVYYPPISALWGTDGTISTTQTLALANGFKTLINSLNAITDLGVVCVFSKGGKANTPVHRVVLGVEVGNVIDTQRRRRRQIPETYSSVLLA